MVKGLRTQAGSLVTGLRWFGAQVAWDADRRSHFDLKSVADGGIFALSYFRRREEGV